MGNQNVDRWAKTWCVSEIGADRSVQLESEVVVELSAGRVPSIRAVCNDPEAARVVDRLLSVAVNGLPRMFRPDPRTFAFTQQRGANGELELIGESVRYAAIVLLGLSRLPEDQQRRILHGDSASSYCERMIGNIETTTNVGDVALIAWAAAELDHPQLDVAISRLRTLDDGAPCETVPAAWIVAAFTAARDRADTGDAAHTAARRLLACSSAAAGVFPHHTDPAIAPRGRAHVSCFADQVYPIQALARYADAYGHDGAMRAANNSAAQICEVMGPAGQWWWHYDARTGDVIEGYPVYSVHQDSMAPMALLDLADAGGDKHPDAIRLGLSWMAESPEIGRSLIDESEEVIWRKVGRGDPKKLVRAARAAVSAVRPGFRLGVLDSIFPPTVVDEESRPYHLGWILYAWLRESQ
jgi:hypothetical protein